MVIRDRGPMAGVGREPDSPTREPALRPIVGSLGADERLIRSNAAADLGTEENAEFDG